MATSGYTADRNIIADSESCDLARPTPKVPTPMPAIIDAVSIDAFHDTSSGQYCDAYATSATVPPQALPDLGEAAMPVDNMNFHVKRHVILKPLT